MGSRVKEEQREGIHMRRWREERNEVKWTNGEGPLTVWLPHRYNLMWTNRTWGYSCLLDVGARKHREEGHWGSTFMSFVLLRVQPEGGSPDGPGVYAKSVWCEIFHQTCYPCNISWFLAQLHAQIMHRKQLEGTFCCYEYLQVVKEA